MNRWELINHLIGKNNYKHYLEIGYYKGWCFDSINCENKMAVDPNPVKNLHQETLRYRDSDYYTDAFDRMVFVYKISSDDYFANLHADMKWDLIFIDGLHEAKQVERDIAHALEHINPGGTIVLHDCSPPEEGHTTHGINGNWTGDTYKAILSIHSSNVTDFIYYTVDTDWGCGVLKPFTKFNSMDANASFHGKMVDFRGLDWERAIKDWSYFDTHRKELLHLITVEDFLEREQIFS